MDQIDLDKYIETNLCINLTTLEITPHDGELCYSSSLTIICSSNVYLILFVFLFLLYI